MLFWALYLLLLYVVFTDVMYRTIYNITNICIFITSFSIMLVHQTNAPESLITLYIFMTPISLVLFYFGIWGGGDAKLILAVMPALNLDIYLDFLLLMSMLGAIFGIIILMYCRKKRRVKPYMTVPYGVPIALSTAYQVFISV